MLALEAMTETIDRIYNQSIRILYQLIVFLIILRIRLNVTSEDYNQVFLKLSILDKISSLCGFLQIAFFNFLLKIYKFIT